MTEMIVMKVDISKLTLEQVEELECALRAQVEDLNVESTVEIVFSNRNDDHEYHKS
jgi:hypothetical protein